MIDGANTFTYQDKLILLFREKTLPECICVYSLKQKKCLPIRFPADNHKNQRLDMISCQFENNIYFCFHESIYALDADNNTVRLLHTFDQYLYGLSAQKNNLCALSSDNIITMDVTTGNILSVQDNPTSFIPLDCLSNEHYFLFGRPKFMGYTALSYRLDNHEAKSLLYEYDISIKFVLYLSHERATLFYSSGYVALVDLIEMKLIENFMLPKGYSFLSVAYNEKTEELAVSICKNDVMDRPTTLYLVDTTYHKEQIFRVRKFVENHYYENFLCYSVDGNNLFENNMGTIIIYDVLDDYTVISQIELGQEVKLIKAYPEYIACFCHK